MSFCVREFAFSPYSPTNIFEGVSLFWKCDDVLMLEMRNNVEVCFWSIEKENKNCKKVRELCHLVHVFVHWNAIRRNDKVHGLFCHTSLSFKKIAFKMYI